MRTTSSSKIQEQLTKAKPVPTDVAGVLNLLEETSKALDVSLASVNDEQLRNTALFKFNRSILAELNKARVGYAVHGNANGVTSALIAKQTNERLSQLLNESRQLRTSEVKHSTYSVMYGDYKQEDFDSESRALTRAAEVDGFISESSRVEQRVAPDPFANILVELQRSINAVQSEIRMNAQRMHDLIAQGDRLIKHPGYLYEAKQCYEKALELNVNLHDEQADQKVRFNLTSLENTQIPVNVTNFNKEQVLDIIKVMSKEASVKLMEKVLYGQDANDNLRGFFWKASGLTSCDLTSGTLQKMKVYYDEVTAADLNIKANQIMLDLEGSKGGQRSISVNKVKESTFDLIMKCDNHDDKEMLLKAALNPHTDIGRIFWYKRGGTEPSLKSGTLAKLLDALNQLNVPVEVKKLTSSQQKEIEKRADSVNYNKL